jgi:2-amino-4-hydroxy-6-hydroxymethyldihydropteridine diphosphokinase
MQLLAVASLYETDPVDCPPGSPLFINTVMEVRSDLQPLDLLRLTQSIEAQLGRPQQREHHAPRPLDLDLLYAEGITLDHAELQLPHPRLQQRRFVLAPLAEIHPELILPGHELMIKEHLQALPAEGQGTRVVADASWLECSFSPGA